MAIYTFKSINSTNLHLKQNFNNYKNFDVISADHQTNGYGRFKREWIDLGNENIFMSICLKFDDFNENILCITQYTALILAKTFEHFDLKPEIKWPNDILINKKKISGILAESVINNSKIAGIVLGIGINLNSNDNNFKNVNQKVTSLKHETQKDINKNEFINLFMGNFKNHYNDLLKQGFKIFKNDYISYLTCLEKEITIKNRENEYTGITKGITDNGLIILNINGTLQEISAGDIQY